MTLHDCTCPAPCNTCPPLTTDTEADAEYRATAHMFSPRSALPCSRVETPRGVFAAVLGADRTQHRSY